MDSIQFILSQPSWYLLLFILGLFSITRLSLFLLCSIYTFLLRPSKNLRRYGEWAIVTGPTSGIGQSFAFELARNGMNLILVGRNADKLEQVKLEISGLHETIKIKTVIFDLSGDSATGLERLREAIHGLDVGVLINNAGRAEPSATYFHDADIEAWIKMVRVNLNAVADITHAVLPSLLKKKKGAIVNIGSGSSVVIPSYPLYATYAATKAFVAQFSQSLYVEYRSKGIDVQCQIPLYVVTKMTSGVFKKKRSSLFLPDSDAYARAAIQCIGYDRISMPNIGHFLQWCFVSLLPDFLNDMNMLKSNLKQREILRRRRERKNISASTS
ncbi:Very-long-chain 3-oxoacyl-CoA reductase 1 [Rhynchospora pubera]|uniref:Very-long-chain 3-oxoacyl-CoA reductase 1 n=1 Tax=Rhynchospora pubera TaxID=906938 RepID=A0AAV8D1M5_9POAL|nr:Very-long-chain 3-oxoacyl-CoA reductase 1 [Rhynchospora pubera]